MAALLLAEGGILADLGINLKVVAVQALVFIATFLALKRLLFARIMEFMTRREAEAAQAAEKVRHDREEAERLAKEYEAQLVRIDKEAWDRLQGVLKEAVEARARIVAEAQQKAAQEARAAVATISQEQQAALSSLRNDVPALARQAVERVLGVPLEPDALEAAVKGGAR